MFSCRISYMASYSIQHTTASAILRLKKRLVCRTITSKIFLGTLKYKVFEFVKKKIISIDH